MIILLERSVPICLAKPQVFGRPLINVWNRAVVFLTECS